MSLSDAQLSARVALLEALRSRGYAFVTPTPATHARVLARPDRRVGASLRDVFGWSLPFHPDRLDGDILALMRQADVLASAVDPAPAPSRSTVRVSSLDGRLLMHDAYPTDAQDAVFFGPDSYRFAAFIRAELGPSDRGRTTAAGTIVDIGAGAGVGALAAAACRPEARLVLTDVNPRALQMARVNARAAGVTVETHVTSGLDEVEGPFDLALANPPYLMDEAGRAYRDGGGLHGGQLSLDLSAAAVGKLAPGGRLLLYTGAAIVEGRNPLCEALTELAEANGCQIACRELDPDVFGEELDQPAYAEVERIALIGAVLSRT